MGYKSHYTGKEVEELLQQIEATHVSEVNDDFNEDFAI
jgi:hypothetical protein